MTTEVEEKPVTALTTEARAQLALKSSKTEVALLALSKKNVAIVAITNKAGREQAHGAAMELKTTRTDIEKIAKAAREDATKFSKAVIAEEKRLIDIIQPEETRLFGLRDGWDQEQERIRQEEERVECERILVITARIAKVREIATLAAGCRTSARVQTLVESIQAADLLPTIENYAEFLEEATAVHAESLESVNYILRNKQEEEAEAARVKAEQEAETARLADEAAKLAEASAQLARDRADLERQRAALTPAPTAEPAKAVEPVKTFDDEVSEYAAAVASPIARSLSGPALVLTPKALEMPAASELVQPSDRALIACAADAITQRFGLSYNDAINRLAEIQDWIEVDAEIY